MWAQAEVGTPTPRRSFATTFDGVVYPTEDGMCPDGYRVPSCLR